MSAENGKKEIANTLLELVVVECKSCHKRDNMKNIKIVRNKPTDYSHNFALYQHLMKHNHCLIVLDFRLYLIRYQNNSQICKYTVQTVDITNAIIL